MSCWGDETDPTFLHAFFLDFGPDSQLFQPVIESVIGLAPVKHPHKDVIVNVLCSV